MTLNSNKPNNWAMANFKYKTISIKIADKLAQILPDKILIEQRRFIKGKQINDSICLTSKAINMLWSCL
jgi:hypothetical protein